MQWEGVVHGCIHQDQARAAGAGVRTGRGRDGAVRRRRRGQRGRDHLHRARRLLRRRAADPQPVAESARLFPLGSQLRAPDRRGERADAHRRQLQRRDDQRHDRSAERRTGAEPAAVQRAERGHRRRLADDRRQRHRVHRNHRELHHLQPVLDARARTSTTPGGHDQLAERIENAAPKVAAVLQGIHARSPNARVFVVNYPQILPTGSGCWPTMPLAFGDVPYLQATEERLNSMLATEAAPTTRRSSTGTRRAPVTTPASRARPAGSNR